MWTWRYQGPDGGPVQGSGELPDPGPFPSQSDAETWLGESWRELRDGGVQGVTLLDGTREVYGPMSLDPA